MRGQVDLVNEGSIEGWIAADDTNYVDRCILIFIDGVEVSRGYAYLSRPDLIEAGISNAVAFRIPFSVVHHHGLRSTITVVDEATGFILPPGKIDFTPESVSICPLFVGDISDRLRNSLSSIDQSSRLNREVADIVSLLGMAVDRTFALGRLERQSVDELRSVVEKSGGLGGMLGHLMGLVQQKYPPQIIPAHPQPKVSIIIPVHNKFDLTYNCLSSILRSMQTCSFEVILVDDCSTDETILTSLIFFGEIKVVRNRLNLGFVGTCNAGAAMANGELLFFLNNDTLVEGEWLDSLVECFEAPDIGIAGSRLLFQDRTLQECGGIIWQDGSGWNWGRGQSPDDPKFKFFRDVDYVSGAALMIRKSVFQELDGFDNYYAPAYYEDTDLCFRVRQLGLRVVVQPASTIVHLEGQSNGTDLNSGLKRYQVINQRKFISRWKSTIVKHRPNGVDPELEANRRASKRVLFLDDTVPTPDQDAGSNAAFEHMRSLQRLGYHVVFVGTDNMANIEPYTGRLEAAGVECVYVPYYWSVEDYLRRTRMNFDLVYVHRFSNANKFLELVRQLRPNASIIYNVADLHFLREQREAQITLDVGRATQIRNRGGRELELISLADATIVHSSYEQTISQEKVVDAQINLVRWPFPIYEQSETFAKRSGLAFVGGYRHPPNVDAAKWFCDLVLPRLMSLTHATFELIGSNMPIELSIRADPGLVTTGFIPDLQARLVQLRLTVAPLRYGAGLKGKVLSSFACGTPCVMTNVAAEGMDLPKELRRYVVDDVDEFIYRVIELNESEDAWSAASTASLSYIRDNYSTSVVDDQMLATLRSAKAY